MPRGTDVVSFNAAARSHLSAGGLKTAMFTSSGCVKIAMEKHHFYWGKSTILMVMFHTYVLAFTRGYVEILSLSSLSNKDHKPLKLGLPNLQTKNHGFLVDLELWDQDKATF